MIFKIHPNIFCVCFFHSEYCVVEFFVEFFCCLTRIFKYINRQIQLLILGAQLKLNKDFTSTTYRISYSYVNLKKIYILWKQHKSTNTIRNIGNFAKKKSKTKNHNKLLVPKKKRRKSNKKIWFFKTGSCFWRWWRCWRWSRRRIL